MKFNWFRTRRGKLREKISIELQRQNPDIEYILDCVDEYEVSNLNTINKLKRKRFADAKKINGALRQTINAHGPITKELIGSATKRILGNLLENKKETLSTKILKIFKWKTKKQ